MVELVASDIELIVIRWLERRKIAFKFQTSFAGGFTELGGAVIDITIGDLRLAWRINGEYWHRGVVPEGKAALQKEAIEADGYIVVDLEEQDIKERTNETLTKALLGQEML
ncbi:hypothetical protein LCGC14_2537680 [marine sediment metagenome]|uniref:DUF559 domain-containing protein n=1 Tax=marine sediment metagenome TaxID=412755 RepID=A0A0F9BEM1_9ZZZZ